MLHVLLLILKILGIILLIMTVLLLLILYAVLFVAATWRIDLKKEDTFQVSGSAGWLFRIVTVRYRLDGAEGWKQDLQIRLFGFPILKPFEEKKPKKEKRKRLKRKKKQTKKTEKKQDPKPVEEVPVYHRRSKEKESVPAALPSPESKKKRRKKKESFFQKLVFAIRRLCDKIKHIWQSILGVGDTIRGLFKRKDDFLEFWNLQEHRDARGAVWKEAGYLWKKSRPKKIQGSIIFGFDDPSATGTCLGLVSILYAWYPKKLQIIPDFDRKIFKGDVLVRGKIRFYVFACILWRLYFDRNVRHMYDHWKQL